MKKKVSSAGRRSNKGSSMPFAMRNSVPSSRFHLLAVTLILSTVAVWPIGYTTAEANSLLSDRKVKKNVHQHGASLITRRSSNFEELKNQVNLQNPDTFSNWYEKFQKGDLMECDDDQYPQQTKLLDSSPAGDGDRSYESDGYGYDDDEYDHFNYKRYDNNKDKLNEGIKCGKEESDEGFGKNGQVPEKNKKIASGEQDLPKTTIELINFQAKNINPSENFQQNKEEEKAKDPSIKKSFSKPLENGKESLSEDKAKKKLSSQGISSQKAEETQSDGESEIKSGSRKISGNKDKIDSSVKKVKEKVNDNNDVTQEGVQSEKNNVGSSGSKENNININADNMKFGEASKNDARITEKDYREAKVKIHSEGKEKKSVEKAEDNSEKDYESGITEVKGGNNNAKEDSGEKNLASIYKECADGMSDAEIFDCERAIEDAKDSEDNPIRLRDHRSNVQSNIAEHQDVANSETSKYVSKKDAVKNLSENKGNSHSCYSTLHVNCDSGKESAKNSYEHSPKEPLHLDFPLAELENTDYHRNFIKSLKRYKGIDESSRILNHGDISGSLANAQKKELPSKVTDEQRKRRSRLRRLKSNELYNTVRKESKSNLYKDRNDKDWDSREEETNSGNAEFSDGQLKRSSWKEKNSRRETYDEWIDPYKKKLIIDFEDEDTIIDAKNKRQNNIRLYERERSTHARDTKKTLDGNERLREEIKMAPSKRKFYNANDRNEGNYYYNSQRENYKDTKGIQDDSNQIRAQLFLSKKNDNGEHFTKPFTTGKSETDSEINSKDLVRMLYRDNNYIVLKKIPNKQQNILCSQNNGDQIERFRTRSNLVPSGKMLDNYKITESDMIMKAHSPVSGEELDFSKIKGTFRDEQTEVGFDKKENKLKDLSSFFKSRNQQSLQSKNDENKAGATSPEKNMHIPDVYQKSDQQDKSYNAPLSQAYKYMKDFEDSQQSKEMQNQMKNIFSEGQIEIGKNIPIERQNYFFVDRTLNPHEKEFQYGIPNAKNRPDFGIIQLKIPDNAPKGTESGKYHLHGIDNSMPNSPKHELKVVQNDIGLQQDSQHNFNNPQTKLFPNKIVQNLMQSGKMTFSSNAGVPKGGVNPGYPVTQTNSLRYANSMIKQPTLNASSDFKQMQEKMSEIKSNTKRMAKKMSKNYEELEDSGNLERFIRDFQYFADQQNAENVIVPKTSLQELTEHGDEDLQNLNNLLREIMNNKIANTHEGKKNPKRGTPQKYIDQKYAPVGIMETNDPQASSGKWTSLVYEGPNAYHFGQLDSNSDFREPDKFPPAKKDSLRKLEHEANVDGFSTGGIDEVDAETAQNYFIRKKRGFKEITTNFASGKSEAGKEQSATTTTHTLTKKDNLSGLSPESARNGKSLPEKETKIFDGNAGIINSNLNKNSLNENRRKLLSISEAETSEDLNGKKKQNAECIRKSLQNYLDSLVEKIKDIEYLRNESSAVDAAHRIRRGVVCKVPKCKREVETDEHRFRKSISNDIQNDPMTTITTKDFGNEKWVMIHRESCAGPRDEFRDKINDVVKRENSASKKRHLSWKKMEGQDYKRSVRSSDERKSFQEKNIKLDSKKSVLEKGARFDDGTNIKIRIVGGDFARETKAYDGENNMKSEGASSLKSQPMDIEEEQDQNSEVIGRIDKNRLGEGKKLYEDNSGSHEIYVMDEKQIKRKFASPKNDQINQKHEFSSHPAQVQTIYNSGMGTGRATSAEQDMQWPTKFNPSIIYNYNSSISKLKDDILRNNLKSGNTKVYTYQASEESTLTPVEEQLEEAKSKGFERTKMKNKVKANVIFPSVDNRGYYNPEKYLEGYFPDIIYKEDKNQLLTNVRKNSVESLSKKSKELYKGEDSNTEIKGNPYRNGNSVQYISMKPYQNAVQQEQPNANPAPVPDMRNEVNPSSNYGQANGMKTNPSYITFCNTSPKDEEKKETPGQSSFPSGDPSSHEDAKYENRGDNLNSGMIEAWNSYARAQLMPSKLKGLANKEYQNYRKNLDFMIGLEKVGKTRENLRQPKEDMRMSRNVVRSSENFDSNLVKNPDKTDSKRLRKENSDVYPKQLPNQKKNTEKRVAPLEDEKSKRYPEKVGKRFFYSFRSEVPEEHYNFLSDARINKEAESLVKKSESVDKKFENVNFNPKKILKKESEPGEMSKSNLLRNANGSQVGKSSLETDDGKSSMENTLPARRYGEAKLTDSASSAGTSKLREKRWSSGHLTESHYRKYHKKNFNRKRETFDRSKIEVESCTAQEDVVRSKRDTFDEAVRADMERRMQEERKVRDMLNYIDLNKELPLALSPGSTLAEVNDESRDTEDKIIKVSESDAMKTTQDHIYTKTEVPTLYKSYNIRNGRNANLMESRHTIVSRSQPERYEDDVFMKGLKVRKARKFSDEGFERLTPDVRFSEKGKVNYYVKQNSNGKAPWLQTPFNVQSLDNVNQGCGIKDHSGTGENFGATRYSSNDNPSTMGIGYYNNDHPRMMAHNKNYYSEAENNSGYNAFSGMTLYSKKYNNRKMEENQGAPDKGNAPKQKLVHALSHEAPLLTSTNFINQPTGYGNVQDSTINMDLEKTSNTKQSSFTNYPNEADPMVSFQPLSDSQLVSASNSLPEASRQASLVKPNLKDSQSNEPIMGAVVLLAKKRQAQDQLINKLGKRNAIYFVGNKCPGWCSTGSKKHVRNEDTFYGEKTANRGRLGTKRSLPARQSRNENKVDSYSKVSDQTQETVNDSAGSGTCVGDGDIKTCSTKKSNNFKQLPFTFLSQSQNIKTDTRNVQKDNTANCGEQILEAILGKVESNPQFRKIIGPGLRRRAKEDTDKEAGCGQSKKCQSNDVFILKLRKIMGKFMCDIEKLAEQKPKKSCSKLDCDINQFLREMLEASCGNQEGSASKLCRAQVEPILRSRCMSKPCSNGDQNGNEKISLKDQKKKHNFIMKLLAEYQSLSQSDKKRVEEVGKYLEQQLEELKASMTATTENETSNGGKDKAAEEKCSHDKVMERKLYEDKGTEKKYAEKLNESKCPEGKDTDNKDTADSSNQTKWPMEKHCLEKNANNTCPEDKTLETKTSEEKTTENKNDKDKDSKEDKDAGNKNEDRGGEDKAPKNESSKEKNIENTNTEDKTNKTNSADQSCNKTKSFENNTAQYKYAEEKNSKNGYTENNNSLKSSTGGYPENNNAEEDNESKKKCKSQYGQEAVCYPRKGQNMQSGNAPISTQTAVQNIYDASPSIPLVWSNLDDVNLLEIERPKPNLPDFHKNQKYQFERGEFSSPFFPPSKEDAPSETYGEQMPPPSSLPLRPNFAITAKDQRMPANYLPTHQRKSMDNVHSVEEPLADFVRAKKFEDDSSEISGTEDKAETGPGIKSLEELQKLGAEDTEKPQLSPKYQAPADGELDFVKNDDTSWNRDGVLFKKEPTFSGTETSNIDVTDRNGMEEPEDLSVTPKPDFYQKSVDNSPPTTKGETAKMDPIDDLGNSFRRRIKSHARSRPPQLDRFQKNLEQGTR